MVKGGKRRKRPICGNCTEEKITEYDPEMVPDDQKPHVKQEMDRYKMTPVEQYDGNGNAYKCSRCGNVVIEPPLDMLDGELDEEKIVEDLAERIEKQQVDKSEVMSRAQELRDQGMDMSDAMSQAWAEASEDNV